MNPEKRQYFIWTSIAGTLFLIVGVIDLLSPATRDKSMLVVGMELVAGLAFVLNAAIQFYRAR